jgi:CRISPR-associated endonuclease Csn1
MTPIGTGYADTADNHHVVISRTSSGSVTFEVVSLFQAAHRISARKPVVSQASDRDSKFIMSLCAGDTVEFPLGDGMTRYRIAQSVWANGQIVLIDHADAAQTSKNQPGIASIIASDARKVSVDPIGRVRPARD